MTTRPTTIITHRLSSHRRRPGAASTIAEPVRPGAVRRSGPCAARVVVLAAAMASLAAQPLPPDQMAARLREGGYVLLVRHASSPREVPGRETVDPANTNLERQLDEAGRRDAAAMGAALVSLRIPIGAVLTSPAYRAMQTVKLAGLASPVVVDELGDGGRSMTGPTEAQVMFLRAKAAERPRQGNTVLVTHQPNLARAFPEWGASVEQGETVVVRPDGRGAFTVLGRIPIAAWPGLR